MDIAPGGAVPTCKRGHPRTPGKNCKPCHAAEQARYRVTAKGRAAVVRYNATDKASAAAARYRATPKRWVSYRKHELRGAHEAIQAELDALKREEVECLRSLERAMQTK